MIIPGQAAPGSPGSLIKPRCLALLEIEPAPGSPSALGEGADAGSTTFRWRAPSERIRTASEIPVEVDLADEDAVPVYMKISEKVFHLRRLGMPYAAISERLGVGVWTAKRSARWGRTLHRGSERNPHHGMALCMRVLSSAHLSPGPAKQAVIWPAPCLAAMNGIGGDRITNR
jgi:hypothetical protein